MAKKEQPVTEKPEEKQAPEQAEGELLHDLREAYEQARMELKQTTDKLRAEIKKIDLEEAGEKAKTWIKENPGLAFFLAVGAGMLVGRALTKAMEPPPPPTLAVRARRKSHQLADTAHDLAEEAADRLSAHASSAGERIADRVRSARNSAYDRVGALGEAINQRAGDLNALASEKTGEMIASFSDAAERAADSLQLAARDLSKSIKKQRRAPHTLYETLMHTAKTVFGAFVFKRLSDWIRERY